jgi:opacity protein-like surface antigen
MKAHFLLLALIGALATHPVAASAQQPSGSPRADAWAGLGWQRIAPPEDDVDIGYDNQRAIGTAGGGIYWTRNLRFDLDAATPSRSSFRRIEEVTIDGASGLRYSRINLRTSSVGAAQMYEFFPNAWFTPYAGGGVEVSRQSREEYIESLIAFDPVTRQTRQIEGSRELEPEHRLIARPLGAVGLKAYLSRRAFFRTEARLTFRSHIEHVMFRFGFGADF